MEINVIDGRKILAFLDAPTRNAYMGKPGHDEYDASVFVEACENRETGERVLFVPGPKRVRWFKTDFPDGLVLPDTPIYTGKRVTVVARVYKTPEDYQKGIPCAVNSCTRILTDDIYEVDSVVTRAMSRALRDVGYDIPCDAHIIEGWTPIRYVGNAAAIPEEAKESGKNFIPIGLPQPKPQENAASTAATESSAPAITPENVFEQMVPASSLPKPEKKRGRPRKIDKEAAETATAISKPVEQVDDAAVESVVPEIAAQTKNDEIVETYPISFDTLYEHAKAMFISSDDALAYESKLLSGKSVSEQRDERIAYYARKALKDKLLDGKLGYACAIVVKERGIRI